MLVRVRAFLPKRAYTTLGAGVWNVVLAALGYWLSTFVAEPELRAQIEHYNQYLNYVGYAVIALIACFILYHIFKKKKPAVVDVADK